MSVYKRGGVWWVSVSFKGERIRQSAGRDKEQAKALEARIRHEIHEYKMGKKPDRLWSEALTKWLDGECQRLKSWKKYESHIRAIRPYTRHMRLSQTAQVVDNAKAGMLAESLSTATINRRIALIRRIVNLAYSEWDWLDKPIGKRISLLPENSQRHIYLQAAEVEALADACPNRAAGNMVRLAAYTGLRRSELFRLSRHDYRDGCLVLGTETKTKRPRIVPIPEHIVPIVERLPLPLSDPQLRKSWDKARKGCGLQHVRFHDLRHTYASWLVQSGVPLVAVQELLGHTTLSMTQRYAHLGSEHLQDAVRLMVGKVRQ